MCRGTDVCVLLVQLDVTTLGWVGFGLSPNGGMKNSDMIVAGVKDGTPYLMVSAPIGRGTGGR